MLFSNRSRLPLLLSLQVVSSVVVAAAPRVLAQEPVSVAPPSAASPSDASPSYRPYLVRAGLGFAVIRGQGLATSFDGSFEAALGEHFALGGRIQLATGMNFDPDHETGSSSAVVFGPTAVLYIVRAEVFHLEVEGRVSYGSNSLPGNVDNPAAGATYSSFGVGGSLRMGFVASRCFDFSLFGSVDGGNEWSVVALGIGLGAVFD